MEREFLLTVLALLLVGPTLHWFAALPRKPDIAAHIRHRDPLRIWTAQSVTDLQWLWQNAQYRFVSWLSASKPARDDERVIGPLLALSS